MFKSLERKIFPCAGKIEAACAEHRETVRETLDVLRPHRDVLVQACLPPQPFKGALP